MKKDRALLLWDLTQQVGKSADAKPIHGYAVRNIQVGMDEVAIFDNPKEMIVCIGGSSADKHEWRDNFKAYKTAENTHRGFYDSAVLVLSKVRNIIDGTHKRIVWLGHSRGGAIAQVCCEYSRGRCVTFGAPRPYTLAKGTLSYEHTLFRSKGDPVTRLPWCWLPPFWKSKATKDYNFGRVKGMEHTQYGKIIEKYMK